MAHQIFEADLLPLIHSMNEDVSRIRDREQLCLQWDDNADRYYWTSTSSTVSSDSLSSSDEHYLNMPMPREERVKSDDSDGVRPQSDEECATAGTITSLSERFKKTPGHGTVQQNSRKYNNALSSAAAARARARGEAYRWLTEIQVSSGAVLREKNIFKSISDVRKSLPHYQTAIGHARVAIQIDGDPIRSDDEMSETSVRSSSTGSSNPLRRRFMVIKRRKPLKVFSNAVGEEKDHPAFLHLKEFQLRRQRRLAKRRRLAFLKARAAENSINGDAGFWKTPDAPRNGNEKTMGHSRHVLTKLNKPSADTKYLSVPSNPIDRRCSIFDRRLELRNKFLEKLVGNIVYETMPKKSKRVPYLQDIWRIEESEKLTLINHDYDEAKTERYRDTPLLPPVHLPLTLAIGKVDLTTSWFTWIKNFCDDGVIKHVTPFVEVRPDGTIRRLTLSAQGIALWAFASITHRGVLEGDLLPHERTFAPSTHVNPRCQCDHIYYRMPPVYVEALMSCRNPCRCTMIKPYQVEPHPRGETRLYTDHGFIIWHTHNGRRIVVRNDSVLVELNKDEDLDSWTWNPVVPRNPTYTINFAIKADVIIDDYYLSHLMYAYEATALSLVQVFVSFLDIHRNMPMTRLDRRIAGTTEVSHGLERTTTRKLHESDNFSADKVFCNGCKWSITEPGRLVATMDEGMLHYVPSSLCVGDMEFQIRLNDSLQEKRVKLPVSPTLGIFAMNLMIMVTMKALDYDAAKLVGSFYGENGPKGFYGNPFKHKSRNWQNRYTIELRHQSIDTINMRFSRLVDAIKDLNDSGSKTGWCTLAQLLSSESRFRRCPCRCYQRADNNWRMADRSIPLKTVLKSFFDQLLRYHDAKQMYWCRDPSSRCTDGVCTMEAEQKVLASYIVSEGGARRNIEAAGVPSQKWKMGPECFCRLICDDHPQAIQLIDLENEMMSMVDLFGFSVQRSIERGNAILSDMSSYAANQQQAVLTNMVTAELQLRAGGMPFYPLQTIAALFGANRSFQVTQLKDALQWTTMPFYWIIISSFFSSLVAYKILVDTLTENIYSIG